MTIMQIHTKADNNGVLHLDIPLNKPDIEADVQLVVSESLSPDHTYDFSSLGGRLQYRGDALAQQKALRREW